MRPITWEASGKGPLALSSRVAISVHAGGEGTTSRRVHWCTGSRVTDGGAAGHTRRGATQSAEESPNPDALCPISTGVKAGLLRRSRLPCRSLVGVLRHGLPSLGEA